MNSDMSWLVAPHVINLIRFKYVSSYIPIYHRIGCSKTRKNVPKQEMDVRKQERMFENSKRHWKTGNWHSKTGKDVLKQ